MSSNNLAGPPRENSRREFIQKIGTLATASSLAADAGAAAQPAMPTVRFGKHMVSRLIIGTNTLTGWSHLSNMLDQEFLAWHTPERLNRIFQHCEELGINCKVQDNQGWIAKYNKEFGGKILFTINGDARPNYDNQRWIREMVKMGPMAIQHNGAGETGTDSYWRQGKLNVVREFCKMVRDSGVLVAVNSHRPEVFMEIESQGWDVDYYMTCLYKYGRTPEEWKKAYACNPEMMPAELFHSKEKTAAHYGGEIAFAAADPYDMFKVIQRTKKPCFVYKLLASGRLCEKEEFVEARFKEVFANIKPTDAVVVGMWDKFIDQYAINAQYVRKYGSNTGTSGSAA